MYRQTSLTTVHKSVAKRHIDTQTNGHTNTLLSLIKTEIMHYVILLIFTNNITIILS